MKREPRAEPLSTTHEAQGRLSLGLVSARQFLFSIKVPAPAAAHKRPAPPSGGNRARVRRPIPAARRLLLSDGLAVTQRHRPAGLRRPASPVLLRPPVEATRRHLKHTSTSRPTSNRGPPRSSSSCESPCSWHARDAAACGRDDRVSDRDASWSWPMWVEGRGGPAADSISVSWMTAPAAPQSASSCPEKRHGRNRQDEQDRQDGNVVGFQINLSVLSILSRKDVARPAAVSGALYRARGYAFQYHG